MPTTLLSVVFRCRKQFVHSVRKTISSLARIILSSCLVVLWLSIVSFAYFTVHNFTSILHTAERKRWNELDKKIIINKKFICLDQNRRFDWFEKSEHIEKIQNRTNIYFQWSDLGILLMTITDVYCLLHFSLAFLYNFVKFSKWVTVLMRFPFVVKLTVLIASWNERKWTIVVVIKVWY